MLMNKDIFSKLPGIKQTSQYMLGSEHHQKQTVAGDILKKHVHCTKKEGAIILPPPKLYFNKL
jgi:hypothetical protein